MKIYTRTGDAGETGLLGGGRIGKTSRRIEAIGEVDELNAALGLAATDAPEDLKPEILRVQGLLFELGSELAAPPGGKFDRPSVDERAVAFLEVSIDRMTETLPPLRAFILPGGTSGGATLHLARAICRRAERAVLLLNEEEPVRDEARAFVNRLSDWLFVAARYSNAVHHVADVEWHPEKP